MAAELKNSFSVEANLVEGSNGAFEVTVDGNLIYSKNSTHRFPDTGEISAIINGR